MGLILGVDEAGRGPLAGPVVACAALMPEGFSHPLIKDSKALSRLQRERAFIIVIENACSLGTGISSARTIDSINIRQATLLAMRQAIEAVLPLSDSCSSVIIDGRDIVKGLDIPQKAVVKADVSIAAVSSASIVAKVLRDWLMEEYDKFFPGYNFSKNAGYGTREHIQSLYEKGICPIHRRSFIRGIMSRANGELF
jgi:ribonuclease HII